MKKLFLIVLPYIVNKSEIGLKTKLRSFKAFPYGVLSIASYIKKNSDYEVEVFDCNYDNFEKDLIENLKNFTPHLIGISLMFDNSFKYVNDVCDLIEKSLIDYKPPMIIGGAATAFAQEDILKECPSIDGVCYGEGEKVLLEVLNSNSINHESIVTREGLQENKKYSQSVLHDLDEVIDIDYNFVNISEYMETMESAFSPHNKEFEDKEKRQFFCVSTRGCPFSCSFCMRSSDTDKSIRYASVDAIINHVDYLVKYYGMTTLTFYDDQILFNRERAKNLFKNLEKYKLSIEMPNGISVAYLDEELIDLMWHAGVRTVYLAVESGSEYVIKRLIHKPLNLDHVKSKIELLRKYNYWILGYFVTGMPGETDEHRRETVEFIKDVGFDWISFSLASPVRGSSLFNLCKQNSYIKGDFKIGTFDMTKYIIETPEYKPEYIIEQNYLMNLEVNFVNNYRMKAGDYETAKYCFQYVYNKYPEHMLAKYYLIKYFNLKEKIVLNEIWGKIFKHFNIEI